MKAILEHLDAERERDERLAACPQTRSITYEMFSFIGTAVAFGAQDRLSSRFEVHLARVDMEGLLVSYSV